MCVKCNKEFICLLRKYVRYQVTLVKALTYYDSAYKNQKTRKIKYRINYRNFIFMRRRR